MGYRIRLEKTEKSYKKPNKLGRYGLVLLLSLTAAYIGYKHGTNSSKPTYIPQQTYQATTKQSEHVLHIKKDKSEDILAGALSSYRDKDYKKAVEEFKKFIIQTGVEDDFNKYDDYYKIHMDAINLVGFIPERLREEINIANYAYESDNIKEFMSKLKTGRYPYNSNEIMDYTSKKTVDEIYSVLVDDNLSKRAKEKRLRKINRTIGQELALLAIRIMPIRSPITGNFEPSEKVVRDIMGNRLSETDFGKDPIGTTFDVILGNYSAEELAADILGNIGSADTGVQQFRGSTYVPESTYYGPDEKPVDPRNMSRDRFGNVIPSLPVPREKPTWDYRDHEAGRSSSSSVSGSTETRNYYLHPRSPQEEQRAIQQQNEQRRQQILKSVPQPLKDLNRAIQKIIPPPKKKKDGN